MEDIKGLKIIDVLNCFNKHLGSVPTFRLAQYDSNDQVHYMYIKPEELDVFCQSLNPDLQTYSWSMAIFDTEKTTIQGKKYQDKEVIITFEID